jgi:hypothetical protein
MLGQGKDIWQAEIDAGAEVCDLLRYVFVIFMLELLLTCCLGGMCNVRLSSIRNSRLSALVELGTDKSTAPWRGLSMQSPPSTSLHLVRIWRSALR